MSILHKLGCGVFAVKMRHLRRGSLEILMTSANTVPSSVSAGKSFKINYHHHPEVNISVWS